MTAKDEDKIFQGSGNVFADLGLRGSDELLAKASLVHQITSIARHRHLTQKETAKILGTTQPKVSELFAGKIAGFSMERLIRFLIALDRDVTLVVAPKHRSKEHAAFCVLKTGTTPRSQSVQRQLKVIEGGEADSFECIDDASSVEA
jgi:predicted XRE-type DNA-binding protein